MPPLIRYGEFRSHSGLTLPWKIDCGALDDESIEALAQIIRRKFKFSDVVGIPRGGLRLAAVLEKYADFEHVGRTLLVDDVVTTGESFRVAAKDIRNPMCVAIFARKPCPSWAWAIFQVENWA